MKLRELHLTVRLCCGAMIITGPLTLYLGYDPAVCYQLVTAGFFGLITAALQHGHVVGMSTIACIMAYDMGVKDSTDVIDGVADEKVQRVVSESQTRLNILRGNVKMYASEVARK